MVVESNQKNLLHTPRGFRPSFVDICTLNNRGRRCEYDLLVSNGGDPHTVMESTPMRAGKAASDRSQRVWRIAKGDVDGCR